MKKKNKKKFVSGIKPVQQFVASFILLIISGAFFLMLPQSTVNSISFIDAIFTSTSAVCVTGLAVLDTGKDFTFTGQAIILLLIQLGGLGIMTFSIGIFSMLSGSFSLKWRFAFGEIYNEVTIIPPIQILKKIFLYTFTIEILTAAILFTQFIADFSPAESAWLAVFHSVSAFCNAGFSTFSDSLTRYRSNTLVITAVSLNIILGGLGFLVLSELAGTDFKLKKSVFRQFSLHTKIVLASTGILIVSGAALFMLFEWGHVMQGTSLREKCLVSIFQSLTCRTAGFNSVDIGALRQSTLSVMMLLMFIGGSPGSIAGGIKTTTFAIICGIIISRIRGERQIIFWNRSVPEEAVNKSMLLVILSFVFIYSFTILILATGSDNSNHSYLGVMFEVISAFGTVGLSTGITGSFPGVSKILLSVIMLVGRVGVFAILTLLTADRRTADIEIADENIMIG